MELAEFIAHHAPVLAADEVRNGLILNAFARAAEDHTIGLAFWTLGGPGQCAVKMTSYSIVLGALDESQCHTLAELTARTDYPGVIGGDLTAKWFTDRALELGLRFQEPVLQRIYSLAERPRYPGASGHAREVVAQDAPLLTEWMMEFRREAVPRDPVPPRQELENLAGSGRYLFWIDGGEPVSMAGIVRPLKNSAAVSGVYTPPALRGRGYAGSVTAATVESIHASGRNIAYLYADLNNPFSNRCYAAVGFRPVCGSLQFYRDT